MKEKKKFEQLVVWFCLGVVFLTKKCIQSSKSFELCMHADLLFNYYLYSSDGVTLLMIQKRINGVAATVSAPMSPSLNVSMLWGMIGI